jgi:hypothetical protein
VTDDTDRWVSVTERLPGEGDWRPSVFDGGDVKAALACNDTDVWCVVKNEDAFCPGHIKAWGITAWRRLPEPWKEEK